MTRSKSPNTVLTRIRMQLWEWVWIFLCQWTPKPLKTWRVFWFRLFGGTAGTNVYLHPRARIEMPWNITLGNNVTVGDRAHLYALGQITIDADTTIAQECYLCAGTHDFNQPHWPLVCPTIYIGSNCFLGLRTTVLGDVIICNCVIVGACSLVSRNIAAPGTYVGQPVRMVSKNPPQ